MDLDHTSNTLFDGFDYVSKASRLSFLSILKKKEYPKDSILSNNNTIEDKFFFLIEGYVRISHPLDTNKVKTILILKKGSIVCSYESLVTQNPSKTRHSCITDCLCLEGKFSDWVTLSKKQPDLLRLFSEMLELGYLRIYDKLQLLTIYDGSARYLKFKEIFPNLVNRISLTEIASYINITPIQLSRIRRKIVE